MCMLCLASATGAAAPLLEHCTFGAHHSMYTAVLKFRNWSQVLANWAWVVSIALHLQPNLLHIHVSTLQMVNARLHMILHEIQPPLLSCWHPSSLSNTSQGAWAPRTHPFDMLRMLCSSICRLLPYRTKPSQSHLISVTNTPDFSHKA